MDGQVLCGDPLVAHAAGHPGALEDTARGGTAADGTGLAVDAVRTVRRLAAAETVPLHAAGEALALGLTRHVDLAAGLEGVGGDLLADRVLGGVGGAQLDEVA